MLTSTVGAKTITEIIFDVKSGILEIKSCWKIFSEPVIGNFEKFKIICVTGEVEKRER